MTDQQINTHVALLSLPPNKIKQTPGVAPEIPSWLADSLRQLRPLVETGYENVLLARLIMEQVRCRHTHTYIGRERGRDDVWV